MNGHFGSFTQTEFDKDNNCLKLKNYNQKQFPSNSQELRMALHKDRRGIEKKQKRVLNRRHLIAQKLHGQAEAGKNVYPYP